MLHDVKMIDDHVGLGEAKLDCRAIQRAHIHTHGLDSIWITEPFEGDDLCLFASDTHFQHLLSFQVIQDGLILVTLATCKLINLQKMRGVQRLLFIQAQSFSLECSQGNDLETFFNKAWTDSSTLSDMRNGLSASLLADLFSEPCSRELAERVWILYTE